MKRDEMKTVLLVEDEPAVLKVLTRHLGRCGLDVTGAATAEAVVSLASEHPLEYDVAILDVHLPGMSGLDLASWLLVQRPSQPIVLMTGDPDEALQREALSRGPVSYLLKPFETWELDAAVGQALMRQDMNLSWSDPSDRGPSQVPQSWLDLVDQRSYAGPGHARRVGRLALALVERLHGMEVDVGALLLAAWSHEIGRMTTDVSDPVVVSAAGARLLSQLAVPEAVAEGVLHLHERHDGSGGPLGLVGNEIPAISQILAVADSLEHYASAWQNAGRDPEEAASHAMNLVRIQRGAAFNPEVVEAAQDQQARIVAICGDARPSSHLELAGVSS